MTPRAWDLLTLACLLVGGILLSVSIARMMAPEPQILIVRPQQILHVQPAPRAPTGRIKQPDNLDI